MVLRKSNVTVSVFFLFQDYFSLIWKIRDICFKKLFAAMIVVFSKTVSELEFTQPAMGKANWVFES